MESSTEEQRNKEETCNLYSPCYFFELVIKAFLKCLGHHSTAELEQEQEQEQEQAQDPPPYAEREIKSTEADNQFVVNATRASRRPPRPPLSSGGGGQIN